MDCLPRLMNGGVWVPRLYLLVGYPAYVLLLGLLASSGSGIMDNILTSIGNLEIIVTGVIAFVMAAFVIYFLLHNEYAATKKRKYAEQLAAARAGAEVDPLVLEQYASFDRTYTLVMVPAILFAAIVTVVSVIGLSLIWHQFSFMAVDAVAATVLGAVYGLAFEKLAQATADGTVTERYTDKILGAIESFRESASPAAPAEDPTVKAAADAVAQAILEKMGMRRD